MKRKIFHAWNDFHHQRLVKNEKNKDAENLYSQKVFRNRFCRWMRNYRHRRWENKVYVKADFLLYAKYLKNAFKVWFGKKRDWKEVYFNQNVKPKMVYEKHLKTKTISAWKEFIYNSYVQKERLINAINERSKLILVNTFRIWIKVFCTI